MAGGMKKLTSATTIERAARGLIMTKVRKETVRRKRRHFRAQASAVKLACGLEPARLSCDKRVMQTGSRAAPPLDSGSSQSSSWQSMPSAPKDGSRILVVIRASEQGPSDVDVVRWTRPKRAGDDCWVSTDSTHDCAIMYEDWEVAFWMPLPSTIAPVRTPDLASRLPQIPPDSETGGSGI